MRRVRGVIGPTTLAALASASLLAPSTAAAYSSSTSYSSLAEMPPGVRALFIGTFAVIGLGVLAAVVLSLRKARSDKVQMEQALADVRRLETAGTRPGTSTEKWTLVRESGARATSDEPLRKCPNCGAPVTDGNYVKCAYCSVQLNDPTLDWVLMRIEQV